MTRSTTSRPRSLRKLAYAPLIAAVATGTLCTGAGISTAATDTTAPATTDTPESGNAYEWSLTNRTGQEIYGSWSAQMSTGDHSEVKTDKDHPWKADDAAKATQYQTIFRTTTWTGLICYNRNWWTYTASSDNATGFRFSLEADTEGALFVYPHDGAHDRDNRHRLTLKPGVC
ncbi:hypothetical protein R3Q06_31855 [Rhodococcus erythropolis]|uniref:hypothetical protein n=1 Tax=Rhodococcus erythropolis TaxID=1833 RepID=UPI00294A773B|nr:hypothetical protein [Rhodococcus erythropolis]MDV6278076.1 hypothetical protein [Rhodococcus erythropolis]